MSGDSPRATPARSVRFVRVAETERATFTIHIDGRAVPAAAGDTLMVALLTQVDTLRDGDFGDTRRAGFCLMGACQDCWVWTADGARLRACTTPAAPGMAIVTRLRNVAHAGSGADAAAHAVTEGVWPRA
ncbi:MAG: (2Fe-2S)-binding protein [Janthinobacterium lividum]